MRSPIPVVSVRSLTLILFLFGVLGAYPLVAKAATYTVTNAADSGPGSLRDAVAQANASPTDDFINFGGIFTITLGSEIQITGNGSVFIDGGTNPHNVTIDGGPGGNRIFNVQGNVLLRGMTLQNGGDTADNASGLSGAAILSTGTLTLDSVIVQNNWAPYGSTIENTGNGLTVNNAIVQNNSARAFVSVNSTTRISNSTISGNSGADCSPYTGRGGTLYMVNTTTTGNLGPFCLDNKNGDQGFIVRNSTISDSILLDGSVLTNTLVTLDIGNTILAGSTDGSLSFLSDIYLQGPRIDVISRGGNVVGVNNTGLIFLRPGTPNAQGDLVGMPGSAVNAGLLPLADNGGSVPTAELAAASVARDYGINANAVDPFNSQPLANDARGTGFARISNTKVDSGAYELQTLIVDTTADNAALNTCDDAVPSDCSLRGAVVKANTDPSRNTLTFSSLFNTPQTITLTQGELLVQNTGPLSIGPPATLTVSGNNQSRVFNINPGADLTLDKMTITGGNSGGINNNGTLTLTNSTVSGNLASGSGGGINSGGTLTIIGSTISGNSAIGSGGGINSTGSLTLRNSTVSGNSALGGIGTGGGIGSGGTAFIESSTITANSASLLGGGINNFGTTVTLRNTIVAGNTGPTPDFRNTLSSGGFNLIGNTSGATITGDTTGNILNQNAQLNPLADNGGPTKTHSLRYNSPAIDKGKSFGLTTDQRGQGRPFDITTLPNGTGSDGSDIGAFERHLALLTLTASGNAVVGQPYNVTVTVEPGYTGTVHFTTTDLSATLPADYTFVAGDNGIRQFTVFMKTVGNQTVTATDSGNNTLTGTININVVPSSAVRLAVTATAHVLSGVPFPLTVTAFDAFDNVATGYSGTVHFTSTDGGATLPGDYTFKGSDQGSHTFNVKLATAGGQTITGTDTADSSVNGTTGPITVQPLTNHLVVTRTDDREFTCSVGDCSLREAVNAANALPTDDTITFDPNVFATQQTIELTSISSFNLVRNNGTLTVNGAGKVTITGPNYFDSAFQVLPGANLTINDLGIDAVSGSGIYVGGGGTLTVNNSTISNCVSSRNGLGIENNGILVMNNSTISGNTSPVANDHSGNGGGIYNAGTATIKNSTIANNQLYDCACIPNLGQGGGIYNASIGTVTIANTIIASNHSGYGTDDLYGTFVSQGYNLISQAFPGTTTITGDMTGNILNQFAQLAPLADNGGGVKTHALIPGSPAIDHGKSFGATADERGQMRPVDEPTIANAAGGDGSDIGAFEVQPNSISVNTAADGDDGACTAIGTGNGCTLREAINAANSTPTSDKIVFDPSVFPSAATGAGLSPSLNPPIGGTIQLSSGLPVISTYILISGTGARNLTVRGQGTANLYSVFTVASGGTVTLSGLTITNGGSPSNVNGGAITNAGNLTLQNVAVSGNPASTVVNATGAVFNNGTLTIQNSTVSGNATGAVGFGGGISNQGVLLLQNSTVTGNTARGGAGIHNIGTATLQNSTVTANTATVRAGGIDGFSALTLRSSIVSGNISPFIVDIDGPVQSDGFNLIGDPIGPTITVNSGAGPDLIGVSAQLAPLANNGGPTDTHALAANSPAVDQGKSFGLTTDQRGLIRPHDNLSIANAAGGDGSDIGAFEVQFAPTAADVSISGRILITDGRGLTNASVTLTDQHGLTRTALTSPFGYYRFDNVQAGETYIIGVSSKSYQFTTRIVTVSVELTDVDFVAEPGLSGKEIN